MVSLDKRSIVQVVALIGLLVLCLTIILYLTNIIGGETTLFSYLFPSLKELFSSESGKIIFYSMNSCPHCQKFQPEWEKLVARVTDDGISTQKFTVDEDREEIEKANVTGFPTIRVHMNGKEIEYEGARTSDAIVSFIQGLKK